MHWYNWHTVTERLQGRAYALTRGKPYKVILDPNTPTGCCDFTHKQILINPNLFSDVFRKQGLAGLSLDKANFLVSRAITGHEALHVMYSDPKVVLEAASESQRLKIILNLLEDARIENIGSQQSQVSRTLFRFVNRIAAKLLKPLGDIDLKNPATILSLLLRWRLGAPVPFLPPEAAALWKTVHLLAEKARFARTCADVLIQAREIARMVGVNEESPLPPDVQDVTRRMQSEVAGERSSDALPNPVSPESADEPADIDESKPAETNDGPDSDMEDSDRDNAADNASMEGNDDELVHSVHPDDDSQADDTCDDLEKLVEETARLTSEELDVPQEDGSSCLVAGSTPYRGRTYSDIVAAPYAHYLPQAAPVASELIRELRTESPRGASGPSDSPGRFRARYYVRDSSRPFAANRFRGLDIPEMALSLVIDRSGSMETVVHELRTMAMAITVACDGLAIPLSIWALEGQVHIKRFDEHGPQVLAKIAGIQAETLTRVMPTMRDAVSELESRPEELKQIVMIHDGMPSDRQEFLDWRSSTGRIGLFCLFIMKEEDYLVYKQNPQQLREHMDSLVGPRCYAIAPVSGIAKHWCSFIRNIRNRCSIHIS